MALGDHSLFSQRVVAVCQQLGASEESDEEGIWMVNRLIAVNHKHTNKEASPGKEFCCKLLGPGHQSNLPEPNPCFHRMPEFAASEQDTPPPIAKIIKTTVPN